MPGIVTRRFKLSNAEQFYNVFANTSPSNVYLFISKNTPWADDNNPPTPQDSTQITSYDNWRDIISLKKIQSQDVTFAIPRYNWVSGRVYREYNNESTTLFNTPTNANTFYVMNSSYNVYKCLFNNKGALSTVQPTGTSTSTLITSDGYYWKFLYTIDAGSILKFVTSSYIPVKTLSSDDGSAQWDVQAAAANGAVNIIDVVNGGSNYLYQTGTLSAVANGSSMSLATGVSGFDNIYNGSGLYISSGLGSGQVREIVDYVGTTRTVTLRTPFSISPNTSSTYILSPLVTIKGDGTGATAYANVTSGSINYINVITAGQNYSHANVVISANSSHGSNATARGYLAPPGGHGSDPVSELAGHNVMLNVNLIDSESNTFPTINDFRVLGLVKDPLLLSNNAIANGFSYDQTTRLTVSSVSDSGAFILDETIRGNTSGATGKLVYFANTNNSMTDGIIKVVDSKSNGIFSVSETFTSLSTGIVGTISSIQYGSVRPYTGDIIYIENRTPIVRAPGQTEDIKLVVKF